MRVRWQSGDGWQVQALTANDNMCSVVINGGHVIRIKMYLTMNVQCNKFHYGRSAMHSGITDNIPSHTLRVRVSVIQLVDDLWWAFP